MRRKEREVTDPLKIKEIISSCVCCRLGFYDNGRIYIFPLHFGFKETEGRYIFYFHGAKEGQKIGLITRQKKQNAGFELDVNYGLIEGPTPCSYSARYGSIMGNGSIEIVNDPLEKAEALKAIMAHATGCSHWEFTDAMVHSVCVYKLMVEEISCKVHE